MEQTSEALAKRRQYNLNKPTKQLLYNARTRARKRGTPCDIIESDICIPDVCPILGIPIFRKSYKPGPNSPTIDEIIPGKGYVKDNICVISHKANTMKQNNSVETLERLLQYMKGNI